MATAAAVASFLCCYIVLGKRQILMQLLSLTLLMASTVVFQGSWKDWLERSRSSKIERAENNKHASRNDDNRRLLLGVLPTALIHQHLGSVIKEFALVLGLVFLALLQFVLEGVDLA